MKAAPSMHGIRMFGSRCRRVLPGNASVRLRQQRGQFVESFDLEAQGEVLKIQMHLAAASAQRHQAGGAMGHGLSVAISFGHGMIHVGHAFPAA